MKIAIMQPYFFPYIGYFQLIHAVDKFVFYDDVNYIKGGWINRNNILVNNEKKFFTLSLVGASSFRLINEIKVDNRFINKLLKTIKQAYTKAPYFDSVYPVIEKVFLSINEDSLISEVSALSVVNVSKYLGIKTVFEFSSMTYSGSRGMDKAGRLIQICKDNNANEYINLSGGKKLYTKEYFIDKKINLQFIESKDIVYKQFKNEFIPWLSIIDVLMFNSVADINKMLGSYELV